jgi:hypothetical protein
LGTLIFTKLPKAKEKGKGDQNYFSIPILSGNEKGKH